MKRKTLISLFLSVALCLCAETTITGYVQDGAMEGQPLIGATVLVPGTTVGTITDADGFFQCLVPDGKFMLQISMVGYETRVVNIKGKSSVTLTLNEDVAQMEEVVVVGYGTMKKRDLTGAMSQIKSEDLTAGGATDIARGLQGKMAGVQVNQSDAAPGGGVSITVRGANSFTTSTQPLYVIDGVPFGNDPNGTPASAANEGNNQSSNPLSMINPNDIERIEVLKDASSTAIYGSRGANGVILITTKRGKQSEGKPTVEVAATWGLQQVVKRMPMLDPYTYALYQNEAQTNSQIYEGSTGKVPYRGEWEYPYIGSGFDYYSGHYNPSPEDFHSPGLRTDEYGNVDEVAGADWQDEIYRLGYQQDYNISVSDGNSKGWYNFSLNYGDQAGVIRNTGFQRYGVSINMGRNITSWLEIGVSSFLTNTTTDFQRTNSENTGIIRSALIFPATYGPHEQTEQLDELNWLAANPTNYVNGAKDQLTQLSWWSSSYLQFQLTPWLRFRQNLGLGYNDGHRETYYDRHTQEGKSPNNGKGGKASNIWKSITTESVFTFDKNFGNHAINAVAGVTFERGMGKSSSMSATNFPTDFTKDGDMSLAIDRPVIASGSTQQSLISFLGRINYTLFNRYLFTFSLRTDGSSCFAENNKWATFCSGAFAWRASDEEWIKNWDVFSNLKFRLSYGQSGNQGIGAYRTLSLLNAANYPYTGTLSSGVAMIDWRGPTNPDLKWETTNQFNAGIDFGWINNRLQLNVDYYHKRTYDLLQNITIPASSGFEQMMVNSGNVTNQGVEAVINYDVIRQKDWLWNISANISHNSNRIGGLEGDQFARALWSKADQVFLQRNGCPIGTLYGYVEDGFFDNLAEVRSYNEYAALSDAEAMKHIGEIKYRDINGDGYITEDDRTIIGNTNPDIIYGFTSNLSWKGLSLSFMLQGTHGNDIFNYNLTDITMSNIGNITQSAYDTRWTPQTTDIARWPKPTSGYTRTWLISNRYVEDGSYMKMKYITLAYDWLNPCKVISKINISFTANNVFCITRYSWFDPDVNAGGTNAACPGVDSYSYPSARTYSLGIKVVL